MNIKRIISSKNDLRGYLLTLLEIDFSFSAQNSVIIYDKSLSLHFDKLIDTIWIFIETPYIDKVYRDSYYSYFSTKLSTYSRDCIRLSFFNREIINEEFQREQDIDNLSNSYLGFMILRPTEPLIVGRSVISPDAIKNCQFLSIKTSIDVTVNSIKFKISGFPHASQDTETISCAETTLWAIMEYFGSKYPEYKPILPSKIINTLKQVSNERQIPSNGLNIPQIAFALKEFGFGTKIYSQSDFQDIPFKRLFSTYIESGIPIIVAVDNRPAGNIGHAIICIGHEITNDAQVDSLLPTQAIDKEIQDQLDKKYISLFDNDDINKAFVFIDDNRPIYQLAHLDSPTSHYPDVSWHNCKITYFVVPLYPKIYLEAFKAKGYFLSLLLGLFDTIPNNSEIFVRFFLSSSRSFKHEMSLKVGFNQSIKDLILETQMPKFIWVGEISYKNLIKKRQANGLILLDATEANIQAIKVLIIAAYIGVYISYDTTSKLLKKSFIPLGVFPIFTNNLSGY